MFNHFNFYKTGITPRIKYNQIIMIKIFNDFIADSIGRRDLMRLFLYGLKKFINDFFLSRKKIIL